MNIKKYPRLEINLKYLRENVKEVVDLCKKQNIDIVGVIKGTNGIPQCTKEFEKGGVKIIATSRLEQIRDAKLYGVDKPFMLLRSPMLSEVTEVVEEMDISLNSEMKVLEELNNEAKKQNKIHKVILMADLGDLREGFWDKKEMVDIAYEVEEKLSNLELLGVGTNLGCYGAIEATPEKLTELVDIAEEIELKIGRKLEYISGGATSSLMRVIDGNIPERINLLRVGEGILLAWDLDNFYGYDMSFLHQDIYTLKAEVIEVKNKPSHPVGKISIDAFGRTPVYEDRGMRKRAILGVGRVDYGNPVDLLPKEEGIEVIGASGDHTIIDIEDYEGEVKVGDIFSFGFNCASIIYITNSRSIEYAFI